MQLVSNLLGSGGGSGTPIMWLRMPSQVFTPEQDLDCVAHLFGPGGSGGAAKGDSVIATGGGAGGYAKKRVLFRAGVAYTFTVGAGVAVSTSTTLVNGTDGGNTSIVGGGYNIIAYGGKGGKTGVQGAAVLGGAGGAASGGDVNRTGGRGGNCAAAVNSSTLQVAKSTGGGAVNSDAVRFRNTVNSGRIMIIDPQGIKNVDGAPVTVPIAPVFAGIRARVVASDEGVSGSVSNKTIRTLDGVARSVNYPTDSNYLNEKQIATVINEDGRRTWGSRLATDDAAWQFDSVRATADMINESLEKIYFKWVDKKLTKANLKMMIEDGNAALRVFAKNNDIIGGKVWLSDLNEPTVNANGQVYLNVEFEPVGLMEQIKITTYRNILYYQILLDQVRGAIDNGPLTVAA
ncbi:phage tail sheath C-terminal domain-containing protein [Agrobacterium sp. MS2]|uniref:phage tail sheath C-terminal domain-containing protein n=1 Tax=Agrobacterium sp. MS2 TaxID=1345498 RepID=UPI00256F34AA|nr:phage tail sheath C-terminal domain-containing protein [Agrobacterium sp. MS2]